MADRNPPVQFRDIAIEAALSERAQPGESTGAVAQRMLAFYLHMLQHELTRLPLSEAEASLICDTLNGTMLEPHTAHLIWAEVDDAIRLDGLDEKWHVDGPALVSKLRDLPLSACLALADGVERFWLHTDLGTAEALRAAGLIRA